MNNLIDLTSHVRQWNMMGYSLLPTLQIAIISDEQHSQKTQQLLKQLNCIQMIIANQQNDDVYKIYKMYGKIQGKIHLLKGISSSIPIKDQQFRKRRKAIEKIRIKKDVIFLKYKSYYNNLNQNPNLNQNNNLDFQERTDHLQLLGLNRQQFMRISDIIIQNHKILGPIYWEIYRRYQSLSRFEILSNYQQMRNLQKQLKKKLTRFLQWKDVLDGKIQQSSFGFRCMQQYQQLVISSLQGIYSVKQDWMKSKSIRWQVMQLLQGLWQVSGDALLKQVDMMPLSYIQQQYKMSNYHSIGGFLPDTCFRNIFSPPLNKFKNQILYTVRAAKFKILKIIEQVLLNYFVHSNIVDDFLDKQLQGIQKICDQFLDQFQKNIQSQIQYIHAPSQDFWGYRNVQSSLYSPQQQIYIQIKYIGKTYIKRVFQTIRDTVPRYIGQNLLRSLVMYLKNSTFQNLVKLVSKTPFELVFQKRQLQRYERVNQDLVKVQKLIKFFSLKVNACHLIKNFHAKNQIHWRRMFGDPNKNKQVQKVVRPQEQKGFRNWIKRIFKSDENKKEKTRKRVQSQDKKQKKVQSLSENPQNMPKKQHTINQKQWLLILNTDKQVDKKRLIQSSKEGFSKKMRSAIWLYIARTFSTTNQSNLKVKTLLQNQQPTILIKKQIEKDVNRTFPHSIFRGSMKNVLTRVLQAYSIYDKQISYTQGMNFVAATIIVTIINHGQPQSHYLQNVIPTQSQVQQKAFTILRFLMMQRGLRKVMFLDREILTDLSWRLDNKIKQSSPKIAQLIQQIGFTSQMIFTSALVSALSGIIMDSIIHKRVFDLFLVNGINIIPLIIAQFITNIQQKKLSSFKDTQIFYDYIRTKVYDDVFSTIGQQGLTRMFKQL